MKSIRTDRARKAFIEVFSESCNVSAACRAAGIGRSAAYAWKREDEDFSAAWDEAEQNAIDKLEQHAWDRATIDKSDRMLEILLKGHRPQKYVERREITGAGGGQLAIIVEHVKTDAADPNPAS